MMSTDGLLKQMSSKFWGRHLGQKKPQNSEDICSKNVSQGFWQLRLPEIVIIKEYFHHWVKLLGAASHRENFPLVSFYSSF